LSAYKAQVLTIAEQAEARERAASARDSNVITALVGATPGSPHGSPIHQQQQQQQQQQPGSPAQWHQQQHEQQQQQQQRSAPASPARQAAVADPQEPPPPAAAREAAARNGDMPSPFADAAAGPGWDAVGTDPAPDTPLANGFAALVAAAAAAAAEQLPLNGFAAQQVWSISINPYNPWLTLVTAASKRRSVVAGIRYFGDATPRATYVMFGLIRDMMHRA
jgi:hypothetical protein